MSAIPQKVSFGGVKTPPPPQQTKKVHSPVDSSNWEPDPDWRDGYINGFHLGNLVRKSAKLFGLVECEDGSKRLSVTVLPPKEDGTKWELRLIQVKRAIVFVDTEKDAQRIGEDFVTISPECLSRRTLDEVIELLPTWVEPWLRACGEVGTWLDPIAFKK